MLKVCRLIASVSLCLLVLPTLVCADTPNILLILSDDHGVDMGSYGNTDVATPNLDQLASQGMLFEHAFAAQAICTPSRSSIYTGLSPLRHGAHRNHTEIYSGIKTMPAFMQSLGYRVALAGKTHIGPKEQFPFEYLPERPNTLSNSKTYISKYFHSINKVFNSEGERPFLLVVATSLPHAVDGEEGGFPAPTLYNPETVAMPGYLVDTAETRQALAGYYDLVTAMDKDVGTVLDLLERSPASKDTVVIYASDHGGGFAFEKWTNYEAGLHVPLIVRYKNMVAPGSRTQALVSLVDLLPTFVDIAGGRPIENIDGKSLLPVLKNAEETHRNYVFSTHTTLGIVNSRDAFPIRSVRSENYRYIQNLNPQGVFTNNITEKGQGGWFSWLDKASSDEFAKKRVYAYQNRPSEEFYDVNSDPMQLNNLANNADYAAVIAEHRKVLDQWRTEQQDQGLSHPFTDSLIPGMALYNVKRRIENWINKYLN
mgnify:CR=1 FL=1